MSDPFNKAAAYDRHRAEGLDHAAAVAATLQEEKASRYDFLRSKGLPHAEAVKHVEAASRPMEATRQEDLGDQAIGLARELNPLLSFKDEASGVAEAVQQAGTNLVAKATGAPVTRSIGEAYTHAQNAELADEARYRKDHPLASAVANIAAAAVPAVAGGWATGASVLPAGATFLSRLKTGAGLMAAYGAGTRLGEGTGVLDRLARASEPTAVARDLALGTVAPSAVAGGQLIGRVAQKATQAVRGFMQNNPDLVDAIVTTASPRTGAARNAIRIMRNKLGPSPTAVPDEPITGTSLAEPVRPSPPKTIQEAWERAQSEKASRGPKAPPPRGLGRVGAVSTQRRPTPRTREWPPATPSTEVGIPEGQPPTPVGETQPIDVSQPPNGAADDLEATLRAEIRRRGGTPAPERVESSEPLAEAVAEPVEEPVAAKPRAAPKGKIKDGQAFRAELDAEARRLGLDPDAIRAGEVPAGDRAAYGKFLKTHAQGSAQRRGQVVSDTRLNADAQAKMAEIQTQADALPPEADAEREALYRQWKTLKNEYGRTNLPTMIGAGAISGGALVAANRPKQRLALLDAILRMGLK